jgi:thiol-disulfide isomerase/thioredoxin
MEIEGVTLGGEKFDWGKYQGKVLLVQFWATWCGPCRQEIANVLRYYDLYHDRGFDVIGISIDEDPEALAAYLQRNELPWVTLFDEAEKTEGSIASMQEHYGVFGVPQLILVGPDQKVVSLNVRGPRLGEELEKLLGPVEEKKPEEGAKETG